MVIDVAKKETFLGYQLRLRELGVTFLGEGSFGTVYEHPTNPKVAVKIVRSDTLYLRYAEFCMRHTKNPWLPRIHEVTPLKLKDAPKAYSVFMERLKPAAPGDFTALRDGLRTKFKLTLWTEPQWFSKDGWKLVARGSDPAFAQLANYFADQINRVDLNSNNIMHRGSQIVFTDPVA